MIPVFYILHLQRRLSARFPESSTLFRPPQDATVPPQRTQLSAREHQIGHRKQRVQVRRVLRQPPVEWIKSAFP